MATPYRQFPVGGTQIGEVLLSGSFQVVTGTQTTFTILSGKGFNIVGATGRYFVQPETVFFNFLAANATANVQEVAPGSPVVMACVRETQINGDDSTVEINTYTLPNGAPQIQDVNGLIVNFSIVCANSGLSA